MVFVGLQGWQILTRKAAMAPPVRYPARTSDQWLRYSATRTMPTRTANERRVRQRVGLVSLVPLVLHTRVIYICRKHKIHIYHDYLLSNTTPRCCRFIHASWPFYPFIFICHVLLLQNTARRPAASLLFTVADEAGVYCVLLNGASSCFSDYRQCSSHLVVWASTSFSDG